MPHEEYRSSDGEVWPSATMLTALLPQKWIWSWYKNAVYKSGKRGWQRCLAQTKRGGKIGTEVHGLIEGFINKQPFEISGKYESQLFADALYDKVNPLVEEYVAIEPHLKNEAFKLHGTADFICRRNDMPGLWVGDWKTSAAKSETHPIQLAIYKMCWDEAHPDQKLEGGFIARVDKKSKRLTVHIDDYDNLQQYYTVINALREIYSYSNKGK